MKYFLIILSLCFVYSGELEVEGDLKVTGNIQNQTIDSLQQVIGDLQAQITAMQAAGGLQTRLYDIPTITFAPYQTSDTILDVDAITGYNLDNVIISIFKVNDFSLYTDQSVALTAKASITSTHIDHGGNIQNRYGAEAHFGDAMGYYIDHSQSYIIDQDGTSLIRIEGVHVGGSVDLTLSITADFSSAPTYQAPVPPQNSRSAQ